MAQTHKKLSQKALTAAATRAAVTHEWCWNYERMQNGGWCYSIIPAIKRLYPKKEMKLNPKVIWIGSIIFAIAIGWFGITISSFGTL